MYFQMDRALSDTSLKYIWIFVRGNFCSEKRIVFRDWDGEEILFFRFNICLFSDMTRSVD